eukprot:TRINITY_DN4578_c0_g1_i1.p4 TRINITY_DN4578_c0_g1~~TRINITY_DN4578_c0_g1_i1.p4  ORF type:complete len:102 (-),score=6.33 TRINITY_DN4578_c0_g1_i1:666-971(-)
MVVASQESRRCRTTRGGGLPPWWLHIFDFVFPFPAGSPDGTPVVSECGSDRGMHSREACAGHMRGMHSRNAFTGRGRTDRAAAPSLRTGWRGTCDMCHKRR